MISIGTRERGDWCRRTVENDGIADVRCDFLRLEDQAGVLGGAVSANCDGYRFGRGQQSGVQLEKHFPRQSWRASETATREGTHDGKNCGDKS